MAADANSMSDINTLSSSGTRWTVVGGTSTIWKNTILQIRELDATCEVKYAMGTLVTNEVR